MSEPQVFDNQYDGVPIREVGQISFDTTSVWIVTWGEPFPKTRWDRFKLRWRVRLNRARDAWAVLKGEMYAEDY